ncbi:MAG: NAD(P)/FAD-dependent oxidoreductase [Treponemataceae bacterium]
MVFDAIVVGAGPAGLFAAVSAAEAGGHVLLLERMPSPGRKLLISGSGQCNLTHSGPVSDFLKRYGSAGKFLRGALYAFSNEALAAYFVDRGLELEETEGGKMFPVSRRARDVLDILLSELGKLDAEVRTGCRVLSARFSDGAFEVETETGTERSVSLIIATGGLSYPKTGSSGDGYALAASFGHRIIETAQALTPVVAVSGGPSPFAPFVSCAGNAIRDTSISVFHSGKKVAEGRGDVLFTHGGLSGPGILDLSRNIRVGDELRVSLVPGSGGPEGVERRLLATLGEHGKRSVARVLHDFGLADSVCRALMEVVGVASDVKASVLSRAARRALAVSLAEGGDAGLRFIVAEIGPWAEAMATRGGVDLSEIDPKRMESRLVPGLFFAGEVLDIDGDTGGFNIQAACSTGRLAGISAIKAAEA